MHIHLQTLIQLLSKVPGLGPRSGKRATLFLLQNQKTALEPLLEALKDVVATIQKSGRNINEFVDYFY